MTGHFRKKFLFFRDTREHPEHDAKNRLSISITGSEKTLAEIESVKRKLTLSLRFENSRNLPQCEP